MNVTAKNDSMLLRIAEDGPIRPLFGKSRAPETAPKGKKRPRPRRYPILCYLVSPVPRFAELGIMGIVGHCIRFATHEWQLRNPRIVLIVDCITGTPSLVEESRRRYPDKAIVALCARRDGSVTGRLIACGADAVLTPADPARTWFDTLHESCDDRWTAAAGEEGNAAPGHPPAPEEMPDCAAGSVPEGGVHFGETLMKARVRQGTTLAKAAAACLLSVDQVSGLESGDFRSFHSPAYAARALERYARFLGIQTVPEDYVAASLPEEARPSSPENRKSRLRLGRGSLFFNVLSSR